MKSALRIWLFVSYGMIGILQRKTIQPGLGPVGNAPLPPAASLHRKASHEIFSRPMAPYKFRSLATPAGEICSTLTLVLTEATAP